jgi:hypothetical protein
MVLIPSGKAVVIGSQLYSSSTPTLFIIVTGTLNFEPSGKLNLSLLSYLQLGVGGRIVPKNAAASQLITIGGITKYNAAYNGTLVGPAVADALSGVSLPGQPLSGFNPYILPLKWTGLSAEKSNSGIEVRWQTADEGNMERFTVEKSQEGGNTWVGIADLKALGTASSYTVIDRDGSSGSFLYRIKGTTREGNVVYSSTVKVAGSFEFSCVVFPNPVSTTLQVTFTGNVNEGLKIQLLNASGSLVKTLAGVDGGKTCSINVQELPKGTYFLLIKSNGRSAEKQTILIQ